MKTLQEALLFVLTLPPDCDGCRSTRSTRERAVYTYGDDVAVTLTLCGSHLAQWHEAWVLAHGKTP